MNGYIAFYDGKRLELYAETKYKAYNNAVAAFKAPKSKCHLVYVELALVGDKQVTTTITN